MIPRGLIDELSAKARLGAEWKDKTQPHWYQLIDLSSLRMSGNCGCVIGQTQGSFVDVYRASGLPMEWFVQHGFFVDDEYSSLLSTHFDRMDVYECLTAAWKREIESRLLQDVANQQVKEAVAV